MDQCWVLRSMGIKVREKAEDNLRMYLDVGLAEESGLERATAAKVQGRITERGGRRQRQRTEGL